MQSLPPPPPWRRLLLLFLLPLATPAASAQSCAWSTAPPLAQGRMESHAVIVGGRFYMFGGFHNVQHQASDRHDVYDPQTGAWTQLARLPQPLTHAGFAADGDTIWVAGGFVGPHPGPVTAAVWTYSIATDAWSAGPTLPAPRGSCALVRHDRNLHFFGGVLPDRNTDSPDHWVLDLDNPAAGWSPRAPMPLPRNHLAGIELNGKVLALGGQFRHDVSPQDVPYMHSYDPATNQWTALPQLPFGRSHFEPGVSVIQGQLLLAGGRARGLGLEAIPDITLYDVQVGVVQSLAPLAQPLLAPSAKLIGNNLHVVGGGDPTLPLTTHRVRVESLSPFQVARLNAGGSSWTAPGGVAWCGDLGYLNGQPFSNPQVLAIANTLDDTLYLTERSGSNAQPAELEYRIPVHDGFYRVQLHFAEIYWGNPGGGPGGVGRRVFDVAIEGGKVLDDLDIFASVGPAAADVRVFDVAATGGSVDIAMLASQDRPKVSAIEVLALGGSSFGPTCAGGTNSTGGPATLTLIGSTSLSHNALRLACSGAPAGQVALLAMSAGSATIPFAGGTLCLQAPLQRFSPPHFMNAAGSFERVLDLEDPTQPTAAIQAGTEWHFQVFFRDTAAGIDNLTNGLRILFLP